MFGMNQNAANAYAQVGMETGVLAANPNKLTIMLYEGAIMACKSAIMHMRNENIEQKGAMLSKAMLIIESGLRASLDKRAGGEIAASLDSLYLYMTRRLTQANIHKKVELVQEVIDLLLDLKSAWEAIDKQQTSATNNAPAVDSAKIIPTQLNSILSRNVAMYAGALLMDFEKTIAIYEAISGLTDEMLAAAKAADWARLTELEVSCAEQVELLKLHGKVLPLSKDYHERRLVSIQHILANDSEIRDLVSPQMASLSALLNSARNGKKLSNTYNK
jgi:flagellar protein FliS